MVSSSPARWLGNLPAAMLAGLLPPEQEAKYMNSSCSSSQARLALHGANRVDQKLGRMCDKVTHP